MVCKTLTFKPIDAVFNAIFAMLETRSKYLYQYDELFHQCNGCFLLHILAAEL